ncbi:hypothetical protein GJ496_006788 [Pomphorhynchus laevis]|nr:hypothetical protein GJ496_006788 [Pomphorhynchus laevis]
MLNHDEDHDQILLKTNTISLCRLPYNIIKLIGLYLSPVDLLTLGSTCKLFSCYFNNIPYFSSRLFNIIPHHESIKAKCCLSEPSTYFTVKSLFLKHFRVVYFGIVNVHLCTLPPTYGNIATLDTLGGIINVNKHFPIYADRNHLAYTCEVTLDYGGSYKAYWKVKWNDPGTSISIQIELCSNEKDEPTLLNNTEINSKESMLLTCSWVTFLMNPIIVNGSSTIKFTLSSRNNPWWQGQLYCDYLHLFQTFNTSKLCDRLAKECKLSWTTS